MEKRLEQSFDALQGYFSPSRRQEGTGNPAQLVLFAEHAAKNGCRSIAQESLELYYSLDPPTNQFLIRAHLCKSMLLADVENALPHLTEAKLFQAMEPLLKAVSLASKSECYHFLVYNASVLLWQICRHFQRPGLRRLFSKALRVVVKAVDECVQQEYSWKVELYMNLVLSQLDAGQKEEACKSCLRAIQLASKHVPSKLVDVIRMHGNYNLGDSRIISKEMKQSPAVNFIVKLSKLKHSNSYSGLVGTELEHKLTKLFKLGTKEEPGRTTPAAVLSRELPLGEAHSSLLLELGFFSLENSFHDLAQECLLQAPRDLVQGNPRAYVLRDLLEAQLVVAKQDDPYTKVALQARVKVLGRLEQLLVSAQRIPDQDIIQHVSVVTWNACLPLLQHNLCHLLARSLNAIANALEDIQSLLYEMRVTVHFELAKICAQSDQLQAAIDHLNKAILLDTREKYSEQLKYHLHRFTLRAKIYVEPECSIDKAMKIIAQCEDLVSKHAGDQLAPLLVKACELLAPTHFRLALDGSPPPGISEPGLSQGSRADVIDELEESQDAEVVESLVEKGNMLGRHRVMAVHVQNHLSELHDQDRFKRCRLWGDVAKLARKSGIWDVAATAASFCVEHNVDGKMTAPEYLTVVSKLDVAERLSSPMFMSQGQGGVSNVSSRTERISSSKPERVSSTALRYYQVAPESSFHSCQDESRHKEAMSVVRVLAEVHCVLAECFVYQLKQEGLSLGQVPQLLAIGTGDLSAVAQSDSWLSYTKWASTLTKAAYDHFVRAAKLGVLLGEPHLVNNAAVYLWNYNHYRIDAGLLSDLVPTYRSLLANMRKLKINNEEMVVRVCAVLASGIAKKWVPVPLSRTPSQSAQVQSARDRSGKKSAKPRDSRGTKKKTQGDIAQVDPEATPELKEAIEVCEYAMNVWSGVPMVSRRKMLAGWVWCKQLLHHSIPTSTYDISEVSDGSTKQCQAVVAIEMLSRQGKQQWDFPNAPSLQQVFAMLSECEYSDFVLEVELWTTLAQLALHHKNYELVAQCTAKAIKLHGVKSSHRLTPAPSLSQLSSYRPAGKLPPPPSPSSPAHKQENELLSQAYSLQGQGLMAKSHGSITMTRQALEAFMESARFGYNAGNHDCVLSACCHYWNACQCLTQQPTDRVLLRDSLTELLSMVAPLLALGRRRGHDQTGIKIADIRELLLSICSVTFQGYIDKKSWEEGLKAVELTMGLMPKDLQRDLVRYKIIFKSRLGRSVESDMIKFQEEAELLQSSLWHTAAANTVKPVDKLFAYQQAIQTLKSSQHPWITISYLVEFGEWLYQQQAFPLRDAFDQFEHAVHLLLCLRQAPAIPTTVVQKDDLDGEGEAKVEVGEGKKPISASSGRTKVESPHTNTNSPMPPPPPGSAPPRVLSHPVVPSPSTISDVAQLEVLVRVSVMMSQLHGAGSQPHWDLTLAALAYCSLIWKSVFSFYARSEEGSKAKLSGELPSSPQDWAEFQLSEQMLEYLKGNEDVGSLNKTSIPKPTLMLHYLDALVKSLLQLGLHPFTLPVLNLQLALAHSTLTNTAALCSLLHMRIAQVCLDMGLLSHMPAHMELAGSQALIPGDLANSRVEMEMFRAKREVLEQYESGRTVGTLRSTWSSVKSVMFTDSVSGQLSWDPPELVYQARTLEGEVLVREVWVSQVRLFIQQGQFSKARDLLKQASVESQCFGDHHTLFQIHVNHALLAVTEKDSQQAIFSLVEALNLPCQLHSLMEAVLLLSEAILDTAEYRSQHAEVLQHMMELVDTTSQKQGESLPIVKKATQLLKARLAVCSLMSLVGDSVTVETKRDMLQLCGTVVECSKLLLEWGHYREAALVLQLTGRACRTLGERLEGEQHQQYILQSLTFYRKALNGLRRCYSKVTSVCHSLNDVMLPVEGELICAQFDVIETLLLIFSEFSAERKKVHSIQREKSSIQKRIDEYVREPPVMAFVERDWISTATVACDTALNMLAFAHKLAKKDKILNAKCTYLLGCCYCLMSDDLNPDPPQQWNEVPQAPAPQVMESQSEESIGAETQDFSSKYSTLSMVVRQQEADEAEGEEESSLKWMVHAIHSLSEAISIAISSKQWGLGARSALKLVDCVGLFDPPVSSLYLAFYQSLAVSVEMSRFLRRLQSDPKSSQLGALFCQRDHLSEHTSHESPAIQTNSTLLSYFEVVQSLSVSANHLDLLRSFPHNFRFIVLQHSPDNSRLYAAYLIPPQPPPPSGHKKKEPPPEIEPLEPVISSARVLLEDLEALEDLMDDYLELVHENLCNSTSHVTERDVETMLTNVSKLLDDYLAEALKPIIAAINKENVNKELSVVLLADMHLLALPLETLSFLHRENIASVSRDFSLQMLQHRIAKNVPETAGCVSGIKGSAGKAGEGKKKDKHSLAPVNVAATVTNFKYVLDPANCMMDDEATNRSSKILEQIRSYPKVTGKWTGFSSTGNAMSVSEWQPLLKESQGLIFFGTEKLLTHLPPQILVSLNLSECSFAMVMDSMSTPQSIVQQSDLDLHKSEEQFYFEQPLQTVLLLSMTGVGSIVANQWHTAVDTNLDRTSRIIRELLSDCKPVGRVHWLTKTKEENKDEDVLETKLEEDGADDSPELPINYNCVLYGLPHLTLLPPQ